MSEEKMANRKQGSLWPQLADLAKLPQKDWTEALERQIRLDCSSKEGSMFEYAPIETNQIRLLMLMPSTSRDHPLEAMMMVSNFPNPTIDGWQALSYTWGNEERPGIILISGRKLRITANLEMALRDVRNEHAIPYWIDAICINQADPEEKGHQIRHMRYIYEKANGVTVWLGDANPQIETAMAAIDDIPSLSQNNWSDPALDGIVSLLSKPYWKRIWIIQELVCGSTITIYCGQHSISFDSLMRVRGYLWAVFRRIERPVSETPMLRAAINALAPLTLIETTKALRLNGTSGNNAESLYRLLSGSRDRQATDPRDRIYALLGLVEDINWTTSFFPIDYNLSVEQLYLDVAKWMIVHSESLNLLLTPSKHLPSWCPDWTDPLRNSLLTFCEGQASKPLVCFHGRSMTAAGVAIDRCENLTGQIEFEKLFCYTYLAFHRKGHLRLRRNYSPIQQRTLETWRRSLALSEFDVKVEVNGTEASFADFQLQKGLLEEMMNRVPHIRDDPEIDSHLTKFWQTLVLSGDDKYRSGFDCMCGWRVPDLGTRDEILKFTHPFRRRMAECIVRRQLTFTEKGNIGMVTLEAQEGDMICMLYGCPLPLVLRPHGSYFTVIGEAYLHGCMSLEALEEMELEQQDFVLH